MTTATQPKAAGGRTLRVMYATGHGGTALLGVAVKQYGQTIGYMLAADLDEWRPTVRVEREDTGEVYTVSASEYGLGHHCTCPGNRYRGRCKHREMVTALSRAGRLPTRRRDA